MDKHDETPAERRSRNWTDADIEALADVLEERLYDRAYRGLGKGVFALAKRGVIILILFLAGYGAFSKMGAPH